MGGFSAAFDTISSEYGWTDEQIGELTVSRVRQIMATIGLRRFATGRIEQSRFSWLGRTIATAVTGGYMTDGKGNPAFEKAQHITMDALEAAQLEDAMEMAKQKKMAEGPQIGSTERFLGALGGRLKKD